MMSEELAVYENSSSYYDQSLKKWIPGRFAFTERYIHFFQDENKILTIPFNTISGLEKRQSSLIYAAVVINVGPDKHWFASFPNRDSLYNLLELFWRESLLSKDYKASPNRPPGTSNLGKELLNILHESESTLVNAANSLSDQGKQIEETLSTVEDINSDLELAEKFLKNMSINQSILQMISMKGNVSKTEELQKCFKVSYIFSDALSESCLWIQGKLLIGEKLSLVDESKIVQVSFGHNELISCEVISPWKCRLVYYLNGEKVLYIMCPKLNKLLKFLDAEPSFNEKITYLDNTQPSTSTAQPKSLSPKNALYSQIPPTTLQRSDSGPVSQELQENCEISEEDMEEIANVLTNLQALASEVNKEQQEQMEKIDTLMTNAEKTEIRMKADIGKIQKHI